jgi:hypothetical protein
MVVSVIDLMVRVTIDEYGSRLDHVKVRRVGRRRSACCNVSRKCGCILEQMSYEASCDLRRGCFRVVKSRKACYHRTVRKFVTLRQGVVCEGRVDLVLENGGRRGGAEDVVE